MTKNKKMASMVRKVARTEHRVDAKAMREFANLLEAGEFKKAHQYFRSMDTFVREGIPEEVYTHLMLNQSKTRKEVDFFVKLKGCKKTFKEELGEGVIFAATLVFPGNFKDEKIAMALINKEEEIIKDLIEVEYSKAKRKRVKGDE